MTAETYERLKKIVVEQLGVDEEQVTPEASFVDDLNAASAAVRGASHSAALPPLRQHLLDSSDALDRDYDR